ncbi:hypothetical protein C8J57DRAFT_1464527 [Mycena rebaudengoi]|nr:hypothetical protein C8J57DRAFT_1464527 [Mycena rebaudengoi]
MVILETSPTMPTSENAARKHPHDPLLLSPPINTWKAVRRHRPTCSQSAPPTQTAFVMREGAVTRPATEADERRRPACVPRTPPACTTPPHHVRIRLRRKGRHDNARGRARKAAAVTAAPTAPASPLPRTYRGLPFDAPMHDLSALCVESRIASEDGWAASRIVEIPQAFEPLNLDS